MATPKGKKEPMPSRQMTLFQQKTWFPHTYDPAAQHLKTKSTDSDNLAYAFPPLTVLSVSTRPREPALNRVSATSPLVLHFTTFI